MLHFMKFFLGVFLVIFSIGTVSAQIAMKPAPNQAVIKLKLDPKTLSFQHPKTGDVFTLHLGEDLIHETGGITEMPANFKGMRNATSSYYEPKDKSGGGYACAESSLTQQNLTNHYLQCVEIQYQTDSGCILITEDMTDASPCLRHILFTPGPHGGYDVTYLYPAYRDTKNDKVEFRYLPNHINLLSGNRAEVNGKIMRLKDIQQSPHPFCIGG